MKILKILGGILIALAFICAVGLAALSSPYVAEHFLLPHLASALRTEIVAKQIALSPFQGIVLDSVTVGPMNNPIFEAKRLSISYSPMELLRRTLKLDVVAAEEGQINLFRDESGWNFLKANGGGNTEIKSNQRWKFIIKQISLTDFSANISPHIGKREIIELAGANFNLHSLGPDLVPAAALTARSTVAAVGGIHTSSGQLQIDIRAGAPIGAAEQSADVQISCKDCSAANGDRKITIDRIAFDSDLAFKNRELTISNIGLKAQLAPGTAIKVSGEARYKLQSNDGRVTARISGIPIGILDQWLPPSITLPAGLISASVEAQLNDRSVALNRLSLDAKAPDGESSAALAASGNWNYRSGLIDAKVNIANMTEYLVAPFISRDVAFAESYSASFLLHSALKQARGSLDGSLLIRNLQINGSQQPFEVAVAGKLSSDRSHLELDAVRSVLTAVDGSPVFNGQISGEINANDDNLKNGLTAVLDADIAQADLDRLLVLVRRPESSPLVSGNSEEIRSSGDTEEQGNYSAQVQIKVDNLVHRTIQYSAIEGSLQYHDRNLTIRLPHATVESSTGRLNGDFDFSETPVSFKVAAEFNQLDAATLQRVVQPEGKHQVSGQFKNFKIEGSAVGYKRKELEKSLAGRCSAEMSQIKLPVELRDKIPFNILFIPFTAIAKIGSILPSRFVPIPVSALSSKIADKFRQSQQLKFHDGELNLTATEGRVLISDLVLGSDILPKVYFSGAVGLDGGLALSSGVELLGARAPLPITGTLRRPYPDIPSFASELLPTIGRNIFELPKSAFKVLNPANYIDLFSARESSKKSE